VMDEAGHEVIILDNFCNSSPNVTQRVSGLLSKPLKLIQAAIRQFDSLVEKPQIELGWSACLDLHQICQDAFRFLKRGQL